MVLESPYRHAGVPKIQGGGAGTRLREGVPIYLGKISGVQNFL